jgi:rhodanese-related sulfurtransferase
MFLVLSFSQLQADVKSISVQELEKLQDVGIKIIDIRKQNEIDKTGIIPSSYKLNFYKKDGKINRVIWLNRFVNLVKDTDIKFVLISTDGEQAEIDANILFNEKKYKNPYYLEGGINNWINKNKKTIK